MLKRWLLRQGGEGGGGAPAAAAGPPLPAARPPPPLIARLLAHRGLGDPEAARRYLSCSLRADLPSPFLMTGMDKAAERLANGVAERELIGVWGDYDVDGTTGTATIICFLREIGAEPVYYIPHRIGEGYGINVEGLKQLRERGVRVLVSVDCGVSNYKEIEYAAALGIDVIVVDHHQDR